MRQQTQTRSLEEVLANFHQTHNEVVATLRRLPFDKLLQPRYADAPEQRPLLDWVAGNTYEHYQEHCQVQQRTSDSEIQSAVLNL